MARRDSTDSAECKIARAEQRGPVDRTGGSERQPADKSAQQARLADA